MFVAGYGGQLLGITDPKIVEAMAFREPLSWKKKLDETNVLIELDSLICAALRRRKKYLSYFDSIILDCSTIMDLRSYGIFCKTISKSSLLTIPRKASSM